MPPTEPLAEPMTDTIRVAVATKDRTKIDAHFGQADEFCVYELDAGGARFLDARVVDHYCSEGGGDDDRRDAILRAIADCKALFVARVGDGPRRKLVGAGIEPVDAYAFEPIEAALATWLAQRAAA